MLGWKAVINCRDLLLNLANAPGCARRPERCSQHTHLFSLNIISILAPHTHNNLLQVWSLFWDYWGRIRGRDDRLAHCSRCCQWGGWGRIAMVGESATDREVVSHLLAIIPCFFRCMSALSVFFHCIQLAVGSHSDDDVHPLRFWPFFVSAIAPVFVITSSSSSLLRRFFFFVVVHALYMMGFEPVVQQRKNSRHWCFPVLLPLSGEMIQQPHECPLRKLSF